VTIERAESVVGGALTALITVPIGIGLVAVPVPLGVLGIYGAVVVAVLPFLARWLYTRASGGYLVVGKPDGTPEDLIFSLVVAVFVGGGSLVFVLLSAPKPPLRPIAG
jgi:hypothetical protein